MSFYPGAKAPCAMSIARQGENGMEVEVLSWPGWKGQSRAWKQVSSNSALAEHVVFGLAAGKEYSVLKDGREDRKLTADAQGSARFKIKVRQGRTVKVEVKELGTIEH